MNYKYILNIFYTTFTLHIYTHTLHSSISWQSARVLVSERTHLLFKQKEERVSILGPNFFLKKLTTLISRGRLFSQVILRTSSSPTHLYYTHSLLLQVSRTSRPDGDYSQLYWTTSCLLLFFYHCCHTKISIIIIITRKNAQSYHPDDNDESFLHLRFLFFLHDFFFLPSSYCYIFLYKKVKIQLRFSLRAQ